MSARLLYIMRWFLELDRPLRFGSDADIRAEVERNYRWNFAVNLIDNTCFWFGLSFVAATTVAPLYLSKLSDSPLPIGIAAVIAQAAWFLPQLLTANLVERLPRKKPVIVRVGFVLERAPIWLLVVSALVAGRSPALAVAIFLVGYAWRGLGAGLVATSWQDMIARAFPTERRGRFLGISMFSGTAFGALGALLSGWLLARLPFATNFVYNFLLAAIFLTVSWVFISLTREPAPASRAPRRSSRQFAAELPEILRGDENYRRFLTARTLLAFGALGTGFITVAAVRRWGIADSTVGGFTAAQLLGQALATASLGLLADRFGHKVSLELGALAAVLAFSLAWLAPSPAWYFAVFVLLGMCNGAVIVSGILIIMEFGRPEKRPTYTGLANTTVGLASVAAPLVGAGLAGISYDLLFALSAAVTLVALGLMHFTVREPRHAAPVATN
ncbi:MFS transporter [Promineifilum sp.]|uniref:MFS transporter n=1 Tax=Promineifilum sp. TaxID=2664178 RepID=UPI0035B092AF